MFGNIWERYKEKAANGVHDYLASCSLGVMATPH